MLLKLKKNFYNLKYGKCYILQKGDRKYLLYFQIIRTPILFVIT